MPEDMKALVTRRSFIEYFYKELSARRKAGERVREEDVFEDLNNNREEYFGDPCFPSFDAFRAYRRRAYLKGIL